MWEPPSAPLYPCPLLPSALGLTERSPSPSFCSQLFQGVQRYMRYPRLGTWCLGLPLIHYPPSWGQWLHTARSPSGASWKASSSPLLSACPEHRNSGQTRALFLPAPSPKPTAPQPATATQTGFLRGRLGLYGRKFERNNKTKAKMVIKAQSLLKNLSL